MNPATSNPTPATNLPVQGKSAAPWPDPNFAKNVAQMPLAELQHWANQHVAWNWDGTRIVAGAQTLDALCDELDRLGISTGTVVFDYIEIPNAVTG
jgi:hypothetical protein